MASLPTSVPVPRSRHLARQGPSSTASRFPGQTTLPLPFVALWPNDHPKTTAPTDCWCTSSQTSGWTSQTPTSTWDLPSSFAVLNHFPSGTTTKLDCWCSSAPTSTSRTESPAPGPSSHVQLPPQSLSSCSSSPTPYGGLSSLGSSTPYNGVSSFFASGFTPTASTVLAPAGPSASAVVQTIPPGPTTSAPPTSGGFFNKKGAVAGVFTVVGITVVTVASVIIATIIRRRRRRAKMFDHDASTTTSPKVDPGIEDSAAMAAVRNSPQNVARGSPALGTRPGPAGDMESLASGIAQTNPRSVNLAGINRVPTSLRTSVRSSYPSTRPEPYPRTGLANSNRPRPPTRPSVTKLQISLDNYAKQNNLEKFYAPDDPFFKTVAKNAAALEKTDPLNTPTNIEQLTFLSLYQLVLYCDDSTSMFVHGRYESMRELVKRITAIATKILPENFGVELRFVNSAGASNISPIKIEEALAAVTLTGTTNIGTNLRDKVLKPLVYDVLADPHKKLQRPLLVCAITDGMPNPELPGTFKNTIVECGETLVNSGYKRNAVMFCVNQIGDNEASTEFLEVLRGEKEVEDVLYCTTDRLDEEYKELKANENGLEDWLLKTLTTPIMERTQE